MVPEQEAADGAAAAPEGDHGDPKEGGNLPFHALINQGYAEPDKVKPYKQVIEKQFHRKSPPL